jgi:hypothetical protein
MQEKDLQNKGQTKQRKYAILFFSISTNLGFHYVSNDGTKKQTSGSAQKQLIDKLRT